MKIVYGGPIDEVEVPEAGAVARRGEPVEIDDEIAKRLLEQDTWTAAPAPRRGKADEEARG